MNKPPTAQTASAQRTGLALLAVATLALAACSAEPELQFADWILPMPPDTPIKEYAAVPVDQRAPGAVQLIDDLVIGADLTRPETLIYQPGRIAVSADGTMFVADSSTVDIKVFDRDGNYVKTIGQEGQGPAEFGRVSSMTIAGDNLVVWDSRNRRFSLWTLQGEHIGENAPEERQSLSSVSGLADGSVIAMSNLFDPDQIGMRIVRRGTDGEDLGTLLEILIPQSAPLERSNPRASIQSVIDSSAEPRLTFHVARRERIFVTPVHDYQVLAMTHSGDIDWALRVAWERVPYNEYNRQRMVDSFAGFFETEEELKGSEFDWPVPYPAISTVLSDSAGRLYVFPGVQAVSEDPIDSRPVDVYTPDGDFITAGVVPYLWTYAEGDYVYGTRPDANDETEVVRYRLIVNGQ